MWVSTETLEAITRIKPSNKPAQLAMKKPPPKFLWFWTTALLFSFVPVVAFGQFSANMTSTDNTNCDGTECNYDGPSILINEIMMSPATFDGSLYGGLASQAGEWIELYNPDICDSVDISCFYLGNNTNDPGEYPGGFVIPAGTVVPPAGFALIRGVNAPPVPANLLVENGGNVIELVVSGPGVCIGGGTRLWFPNAGGWFGFYDSNGVPQDAVSWANQSNIDNNPCIPSLPGCFLGGQLASYNDFTNDRKEYILDVSAANFQGQSIRRIPDGGVWSEQGTPTFATCNATCIEVAFSVCNGTATAEPSGGVPPYTYLWDDALQQETQTAERLCAGEYCVQIIDALNDTIEQCVTVEDAFYESEISDGFCEGGSYTMPDNSTVSAPGTYFVTFQTSGGCDSVITVNLEEYPHYSFELDTTICNNASYTLADGSEVSTAGTHTVNFTTIHGCDSTYTVNLSVEPGVVVPMDAAICPGETYELPDGSEVSVAGVYEVTMPGALCDTIFTIDLQIHPSPDISIDVLNPTTCFGENDGSASISVASNTGPYDFLWSDGIDHGASASNLAPGEYSVQVIDANGCEAEETFEVTEPQPVEISASADTLICIGSTTSLLADATGGTGNFNYHWSHTTSNTVNTSASPTDDTSYSVFATDENGCTTDTLELDVSVITMDAGLLETSGGDPVCAGGEILISANYGGDYPPYSYSWSHNLPDGPGPHTVSPNVTTDYFVIVEDGCGNEVFEEVTAEVWPLPESELATVNDVSCNGQDNGMADISVSGGTPGYSYVWSDGGDHGAIASGLTPGNYTVSIADANGCETQESFEITEPQPVEISASADILICLGSETNLFANATGGTGNFSYHWSHTASTDANTSDSPVEDTSYSVFGSDENGCSTDTISLEVLVISMSSDLLETTVSDPVCAGGEIEISANYNGSYPPYSYSWTQGLPATQGPHTVIPDTTTTYEVTVSDFCGNEVTENLIATVWPLPEIQLNEIQNVLCFGSDNGSVTVSTAGGTPDYAYDWSDGIDHGNNATNLTPGEYSVVVSDIHLCTDSASFTIDEPGSILISAGTDTLVCPGTEVLLWAEAAGGTGDYTYHWSENLANTSSHLVYPEDSTTYSVYATDENECTTETIDIGVDVMLLNPDLLSVWSGNTVCGEDSTTVEAAYSGQNPPYTLSWSHNLPDGPGPYVIHPSENTTYTVTLIDACDNSINQDVEVVIIPLPEINLPDIMGDGCATLPVTFTDTVNDPSQHTFVWTVNGNQFYNGPTFNYNFEEPGTHTVDLTVTSFDGCSATSENSSLVIVLPSPDAQFTADPWETDIDNPAINFTDQSTGDISNWNWDFGDGEFSPSQNPQNVYSNIGSYSVQLLVENDFGCTDSIIHEVVIKINHDVTIPTAFTPTAGNNGSYDPTDTSNDIFYPFAEYVDEFRMSIFNRWGELIFESEDPGYGWNGEYRGEPCAQDVYVYKIELKFSDGVEVTRVGDLTLFR